MIFFFLALPLSLYHSLLTTSFVSLQKSILPDLQLLEEVLTYRVTFLTGPAQKSSKYGTGPTQQQKINQVHWSHPRLANPAWGTNQSQGWSDDIFSCPLIIYSLLTNHGKWLTKGGKTQEWHTKREKATLLRLFCPQKPHHLQQHKIEPSPSSWKQIWPPCPACGCWARPPPLLPFAGALPECLAEDDKFPPVFFQT